VIGVVLLGGGALVSIHSAQAHTIALAFQAFAALGTMVDVFTIAIGVGPRTGPDLAYHAVILAVLFAGLMIAGRAREYA
jgi:hypothetical protein